MNRMSLLLAVIMAASLFVQSGQPNEPTPSEAAPALIQAAHFGRTEARENPTSLAKDDHPRHRTATYGLVSRDSNHDPDSFADQAMREDAKAFLQRFIEKGSNHNASLFRLMFATVPDPIDTHLAAAFDHDVSAIEDGIEDSNYFFDSSWIPWATADPYSSLADATKASAIHDAELTFPGILLFRKATYAGDGNLGEAAYNASLIVILLAEKPTEGVSICQAEHAIDLLKDKEIQYSFAGPLRILGPTFSGSFASMLPTLNILAAPYSKSRREPLHVLLRSGSVTEEEAAEDMLSKLRFTPDRETLTIDLGSSVYTNESQVDFVLRQGRAWGINPNQIAVLSEDESRFGQSVLRSRSDPWKLSFPRDISALRSSYERQGILEDVSPARTVRRYLKLSNEEQHEGDSVESFGGDQTVAAQESVLFGIASFLKTHDIRIVVIVATNEADRYFLSEFIHANVSDLRVVIVGATRLFLRGTTSQFWGDLFVSSFPMLPRLYEWTGGDEFGSPANHRPRIFPDEGSQGIYFAARDLWAEESVPNGYRKPLPDYAHPLWEQIAMQGSYPPIYISAMSNGGMWPVSDGNYVPVSRTETLAPADAGNPTRNRASNTNWFLRMPFPFANHFIVPMQLQGPAPYALPKINLAHYWQLLFWVLTGLCVVYCGGTVYANPVTRSKFSYLYPTWDWRHWGLVVVLPALLSQCCFLVLMFASDLPKDIPGTYREGFIAAYWSASLVPLCMLAVAVLKALAAHTASQAYRQRITNPPPPNEPGFTLGDSAEFEIRPKYVGGICALALSLIGLPIATLYLHPTRDYLINGTLNTYREMHWESGLSLVPTAFLLLLAILLWSYQAIVAIHLLHPRPRIATFDSDERVSDIRAQAIADAAEPFPSGKKSRWFWGANGIAVGSLALCWVAWSPLRSITSLEPIPVTYAILTLALIPTILLLCDIIQFLWIWAEMRGLLQALLRHPFRRSFLPIHDFSWQNIWSFSSGSFHERRKTLAGVIDAMLELARTDRTLVGEDLLDRFRKRRADYSKLDLSTISVCEYREDLRDTYEQMANIGDRVAKLYEESIRKKTADAAPEKPAPQIIVKCQSKDDDRWGEERRSLETLSPITRVYEAFLCRLLVAFVQCLLARLRTLAISIAGLFSLVGLAVAIYPFRPAHALAFIGIVLFGVVAVSLFLVFSQMDKDPVLARILNGDPARLEWSFYGKFIEALAPPLLALSSSLLPGGAGRLLLLMQSLFGHGGQQ